MHGCPTIAVALVEQGLSEFTILLAQKGNA
jgi:hypothetical protein